ncbi:MAG TPA: fatty acyl-AMP ligase, partial [Polyangiales bacterium]|nr:fatty acyl-AMP ligase [Polyangiales bacterium]
MTLVGADTLVTCLAAAPRDPARGFHFKNLEGDERFYSFAQLHAEAERRAAQLVSLGLAQGDRVALVIADPAEFVLTFLAAAVGGMVPVPIYPRASFKAKNAYVDTVSHIVRASGAKLLLAAEGAKAVMDEVLTRDLPGVRLALLDELHAAPADVALGRPQRPIRPDDLCFLQFTSGSTSLPKGVMVSHANLVANARSFLGPTGVNRNDADLAVGWLPLYHDMGLIGFVLGTIICDINTVLIPTEAFGRRPNIWLEAMHKHRATITFAPNFAYALATKRARDRDLEGLDLSNLRVAGCGAEPINPKVMREFAQRFARCGFRAEALMPAYGMAEATLAITFHANPAALITDTVDVAAMKAGRATPSTQGAEGPQASVELVCCGHVFPEHEIKIVDESGHTLPERAVGEIWTRGPSITQGYFGNPEASEATFGGGWLRTGDLGYLADGLLYVCGRLKDLIIIRGANFYPQDIEWAVSEVEGVRRDNVVAFSVLRDGEETLVVSAEGNSGDAPALRKAIAAKVAETAGLTVGHVAVVRIGSLPKTSSGKVQRRRTKALFEEGL